MAYEQKDMSGSLFRNEKSKDTQPDYKGKALINGKVLRISAWLKDAKSGVKFMSLSFTPDDAAKDGPRPPKPPAIPKQDNEDDVPF